MTKRGFIFIAIILLGITGAKAQIYSQGKNLNNEKAFFLQLELVQKPNDPAKFHAKVDFYGRRRDIDWYLKDGVEHKAFYDKAGVIAYMENNGWFYLKTERIKAKSSKIIKERYLFRKSMERLKQDQEEQVSATTRD